MMDEEAEEEVCLLGAEAVDREVGPPSAQRQIQKARLLGMLVAGLLGAALASAAVAESLLEPLSTSHARPVHAAEYLGRASAKPSSDIGQLGNDSRPPLTFYMYRAQSSDDYPLENINAADLAGVMWYLHNEVVVSTPRKYKIDRIRRFRVTLKNTQEFWNVHHRNFGAFLAFDAARCTTPICGKIFSQYGFIVGCQVLPTDTAPYLGSSMTQVNGACKGQYCNAPVWYSLPGPCPTQGLANDQIAGNAGSQDVMAAKSAQCLTEQPGGSCKRASGAPDCTFSYESAGEIMLDELVGIEDYADFWNGAYLKCMEDLVTAKRTGHCHRNQEYQVETDKGVGCSFWDGKADLEQASRRMKAVRDLFKKHYPDLPDDLEEPACDFDMYYDTEFDWPANHSGAVLPQRGFSWDKAKSMRDVATTRPTPPATQRVEQHEAAETCRTLGCGARGRRCSCNPMCHKFSDCCSDYKAECQERHATSASLHAHHDAASACQSAREKCDKAVAWAMRSGFFEHREWYKDLKASSTESEFRVFLAESGRGGCDKLCSHDGEQMRFLKT